METLNMDMFYANISLVMTSNRVYEIERIHLTILKDKLEFYCCCNVMRGNYHKMQIVLFQTRIYLFPNGTGTYVLIITSRKEVGTLLGFPIYQVTSMRFLCCNEAVKRSTPQEVKSSWFLLSSINTFVVPQNPYCTWLIKKKKPILHFNHDVFLAEKRWSLF